MSYTPQKKHKKRSPATHGEQANANFLTITKAGFLGFLCSFLCIIVLTLSVSALCLLHPDPSSLTLYAGLAILYVSSVVGGFISAYKLKSDKPAALFSGGLCGFMSFVFFGLCSIAMDFLAPDNSHGLGIFLSLALRSLSILFSFLGAYLACRRKNNYRKRKISGRI